MSLRNGSPLVVYAKVKSNFRVYGEPVDCNPYFDGKKIWVLFPQQVSQRVFHIPALVQQKGKSVDEMRLEYTLENARKQLTMFLELEFQDEFGIKRIHPGRPHFFEFGLWQWIPEDAETSEIPITATTALEHARSRLKSF
jgi:hypothetical protein